MSEVRPEEPQGQQAPGGADALDPRTALIGAGFQPTRQAGPHVGNLPMCGVRGDHGAQPSKWRQKDWSDTASCTHDIESVEPAAAVGADSYT